MGPVKGEQVFTSMTSVQNYAHGKDTLVLVPEAASDLLAGQLHLRLLREADPSVVGRPNHRSSRPTWRGRRRQPGYSLPVLQFSEGCPNRLPSHISERRDGSYRKTALATGDRGRGRARVAHRSLANDRSGKGPAIHCSPSRGRSQAPRSRLDPGCNRVMPGPVGPFDHRPFAAVTFTRRPNQRPVIKPHTF